MRKRSEAQWLSTWITTALVASASVAVIFGIAMALDREDTETLESPLLLSVAHQLIHGPWQLYGPFGAGNPLVIIHAPLYYHLAALAAWPLVRAGVDPVTAALAGGRALSFLGLVSTLVSVFQIARLDGAPFAAGLWAALLVAASLVVGVIPYTVRPDMLGVALQTMGVLIVMSALRSRRPGIATLPAAYTAFALAVCIKQHFIAVALVSTILLLGACLRGRLSFRRVVPGLMIGLAIVTAVYGTEELATQGRMSQAVFQAASSVSWVHPGGWTYAWLVFFVIVGKNAGLIALLLGIGLVDIRAQPGIFRHLLAFAGVGLIAVIAARTTLIIVHIDVTHSDLTVTFITLVVSLFLVIPACFLVSLRARSWKTLDVVLCAYMAAEVALLLVLSRTSNGAWINYGIQAVVFASVFAARALARVCSEVRPPRSSALIVVAAVTVLLGVLGDVKFTADQRREARTVLGQVFRHFGRPTNEFFFVDRPGYNRVHGRLDLVYDHWLYPVFEAAHLAEPRSSWLQTALTSGDIRFIVTDVDKNSIDGLGLTLAQLGYQRGLRVGSVFVVWIR